MCDQSVEESPYPFAQTVRQGKFYNLSFPNADGAYTFNLAETTLNKSKDNAEIQWNYPRGVLTMIIETGYMSQLT